MPITNRYITSNSSASLLGRVAAKNVTVFSSADVASTIVRFIPRDTILTLLDKTIAKNPEGNLLWYRVLDGWVHSGNLQIVEFQPQTPIDNIDSPVLGEIAVPITQSYQAISPKETILYRYYFHSIHTITGIVKSETGKDWYKVYDPRLRITLYAPAEHVRILASDEYAPIPSANKSIKKRIEISTTTQTLTAYEDGNKVFSCLVSTGLATRNADGTDNATPKGEFRIQLKVPNAHMGDGHLTKDPEAYEIPGVPWVSYFEPTLGIALHGAYWHTDFGRPRSHGCVNLAIADALWLYRWTNPAAEKIDKPNTGFGTQVVIS